MNHKIISPAPSRRANSDGPAGRPAAVLKEGPAWACVPGGWRVLFGGFYELGVCVEWHDFSTGQPFPWSRSFHPNSLELCLNMSGRGSIRSDRESMEFEPQTAGFYSAAKGGLQAWREAGEQHRFVTVEFSAGYLSHQLAACDGALHPLVEAFLRGGRISAGVGEIAPLSLEHQRLVEQLVRPPVFQGARGLWYQSKVLQLIVDFCFAQKAEDELFCDRQKRIARERVNRVMKLLQQRLAEPPSLEEIGRAVGCSPFYLSRTFSSETRMSIPQYLRKLRMERAAELLRSGQFNVTEAAMEVGYSSLSHFSQAFCQVMGCCPALYPLGRKRTSEQASVTAAKVESAEFPSA